MASTLVRLSDQILLEYFYDETDYRLNEIGLKRCDNRYDNSITILNDKLTGNYAKYTCVQTDTDNVLLDENGTYHYYDENVNISIKDVNLVGSTNYKCNKVRVHIMSGYNFDDCNGFNVNVYIEGENKKLIYLSNYVYLKSSVTQMIFNPKPIKISEAVFDKYVEFSVSSLENLIEIQNAGSGILFPLLDVKIKSDHKIYIDYNKVNTVTYKNGFATYTTLDNISTVISSIDRYGKIENHIELSEDGSYFEFQARYDGKPIEDFIYQLNSMKSNNYYVIHSIKVVEQVGSAFHECDEYSLVQKRDYEKMFRFRPVLYNKGVIAVSIDYEMKLMNEVDGTGISKTGSITSDKPELFREKLVKINVSGGIIKTYNRIASKNQNVLQDNLQELVKTKVVTTYITNNNIGIEDEKPIQIIPFRNALKITLHENGITNENILTSDCNYYLVFIKNDSSKLYIKETLTAEINKNNGELMFTIEEQIAKNILLINNRDCYIISKSSKSESVVSKMLWTK